MKIDLGACLCVLALALPATARAAKVNDVHSFTGGTDGGQPIGDLVQNGGLVYGTTFSGGDPSCTLVDDLCGTVFSYDPASGALTTLYRFTGSSADGGSPTSLMADPSGRLYGSTERGGNNGSGTLFSFDPTSGHFKKLYSFPAWSGGYRMMAS